MDNLIFSVNVVLPMFLLMCIGVLLRKFNLFDDIFLKTANNVAFKAFLPTLLFYNIYKSHFADSFNINIVIFAVASLLVTVAVSFLIVPKFEKNNKNRGVLIQALMRSNFVLFGIPICTNIFGEESIGITSMLIAIIVPMFNFLSVLILAIYADDKFSIKKTSVSILKNPMIIGSLLGVLVSVSNIRLPVALESTVADVASIATPLVMILLGGGFELGNCRKNLKYLVLVSVGKLAVIPSLVLAVAVVLGFRGMELGALLAMTASPVAVSSFVMAQQSNANHELAGQIVVVTTTFCSVTMFILIFAIKSFGFF